MMVQVRSHLVKMSGSAAVSFKVKERRGGH
jgi:hypothetical protein